MQKPDNIKIGVIGLGYVGLPLAVAFGRKFPTLGFDINSSRITELKEGIDTLCKGIHDIVILAVPHHQFQAMGAEGIRALCKPKAILFDVKSVLPKDQVDLRL